MRIMAFLLACLCVLTLAAPAHAWNNIGHMAIAKLAYNQLSDGERLRYAAILKKHPHYEEYLDRHRPEGIAADEWVFLRAATWPDWVRPRGRGPEVDPRGERVTRYHRRDDHFINMPYVLPADAEKFAGKDLRPDPEMHTVICAYRQRAAELSLSNSTEEDRAIALCWILHLIGDIHQPLHAASQYSSLFPGRGGDLGGNLFGVKVRGRLMNLHRFWDDLLGDDANYLDDGAERQARTFKVAVDVAEGLRGSEYSREGLKAELEKNTHFPAWVEESFGHAQKTAYRDGSLKAVRVGIDGRVPPEAEELDEEYLKQAESLARQRAALAGHRLADRLKTLVPKNP